MLKDELTLLVVCFTEEVENVYKMFTAEQETPPPHKNMPTIVSRLLWVYGMKQRIKVTIVCLFSNFLSTKSPNFLNTTDIQPIQDIFNIYLKCLRASESPLRAR